MQVILTF